MAEANGVELIDNAEVDQVIIEKKGAGGVVKGVYYQRDGQSQEARAEKVHGLLRHLWEPPTSG